MTSNLLRLALVAALVGTAFPAWALTPQEINDAQYEGGALPEGRSAMVVRLQVMLDRAHSSPGIIDGYLGENVSKALSAFRTMQDLDEADGLDSATWDALETEGDVIVSYRIEDSDFDDLVDHVPADFAEMAEMEWLGYTSVEEKLAERFHMHEELLALLNPDATFEAGETIMVVDPGENLTGELARIEVDRGLGQVRGYDAEDNLAVAYPATVGSDETPSPSGTHEVTDLVTEPSYSYRPDENFQQGENTEPLELPPGPNGPVGLVWIGLSEPSYGLHGTAEPANIDKDQSHGCVRLTNWDALELVDLVEAGTPVEFVGGD